MKAKTLLLLLFIISFFMADAQMKTPDFAFPKTVAKEADADLLNARNKGDAHAALNALIRLTLSESLIDPAKLQQMIKESEKVANEFSEDKLHGLFEAWLAYLYKSFYDTDRWKFNSRKLPLTPLPEDLTEWSGEQFCAHISELCKASIGTNSLKDFALSAFTDIISYDKLALTYYPTLQDFVYSNAINILEGINIRQESEKILSQALSTSAPGSASNILWQWRSNNHFDKFDEYITAITPFLTNEFSGLLVWKAGTALNIDNISDAKKFIDIAEEYLKNYPNTPFKNNILNKVNSCKSERVKANYPLYCSPGQNIDIKVENTNSTICHIDIYYTGEKDLTSNNRNVKSALKAIKPWKTLELRSETAVPFREDTTLQVRIDQPGYYYVLPRLSSNTSDNDMYIRSMRCLGIFPLAISNPEESLMVSLDPFTGSPVANASVLLRKNRSSEYINAGKSNSLGITDISRTIKGQDLYSTRIDIDGKQYLFPDINVYKRSATTETERTMADILLSRSIYHPGEIVDALLVVSKSYQRPDSTDATIVCANQQMKLKLMDANYQIIADTIVTTDDFGRSAFKFVLPTDGLTGNYSIEVAHSGGGNIISASHFIVSDYKMPDFEVEIDETACDVPSKGYVTIKGTATSYSGMPVSDAKVTINLNMTQWGWWRWNNENNNIYSAETNTDATGNFTFVIPDTVLADKNSLYKVTIDIVSIAGNTVSTSTAFALTKKYQITLSSNSNIDGEKSYKPDVKVFAPDGSTADIPLLWSLTNDTDTIASGKFDGSIDLKSIRPARYSLTIYAADASLADPATARITVYNRASGVVPNDAVLYLPIETYKADATGKAVIEYANSNDDTYLYYSVNGNNSTSPLKMIKVNAGYHDLEITLPDGSNQANIYFYTLKDCNLVSLTAEIKKDENTNLRIEGESFRDGLIPGANETWRIHIVDADGKPLEAALALDMYNKALEALAPHSFNISRPMIWRDRFTASNYPNNYIRSINVSQNLKPLKIAELNMPSFNLYGYHLSNMMVFKDMIKDEAMDYASGDIRIRGTKMMSRTTGAPLMMNAAYSDVEYDSVAVTEEAEDAVEVEDGEILEPDKNIDYRDSEVAMAIWAPSLNTDIQGNLVYTFTVPNANTTWRLRAVAWSKDMEIGSLMRDFVASKPVMVQPNLPRFLRQGDAATVLASVMNNTDTTQTITTTVEIFDPLTQELRVTKTFTQTIGPKLSDKVAVTVYVDNDATALGYRVRSTNGSFSDGEQKVIRILSSEASLIETSPFYLNPGDTAYTTSLPSVENARISLTFCENPVWTVVSALPGLRQEMSEYANSAAAAFFSASISRGIIKDNPRIGDALKQWAANPTDSALVSMLQKNEDLKMAVLNSTPWVQAAKSDTERMANLAMIFNDTEVDKSIAAAIKILADLQNTDGGWSWSKWSESSSVWVTANVLDMLGQLRRFGWLPANSQLQNMVDQALKYYDAKVEKTDLLYCLVRPMYGSNVSANGQQVIKATLSDIRKNWKKMSDPAYKAMAARALYLNGEKKTALEIMKSVSEFGIYSKDQGLTFPSVNALYSYGILLDAYATILPSSKEVDGLRQQLIVRKQAADWGSAVVTTQVVRSILSTGTHWTVDAEGAEVKVADEVIKPTGAIETATGYLRADLSDYAGQDLTITTSGTGPAYGAVYAQFDQRMEQVKAHSCTDLDIEKQLFVRRGAEWAVADSLKVGDRVKVQLTIHCKRNMQYVEIIDDRPAAFEPVNQLPGWMWSEGVGFYRENRDAQTNFHIVYMGPGTYLLTYEMNVNLAGDFTSGVATIQSQYAPELSAHSSGSHLKVY